MHDKDCFFGCKRFWDCPEGKPSPDTICNKMDQVDGYELPKNIAPKVNIEKMLGIPIEIDEE